MQHSTRAVRIVTCILTIMLQACASMPNSAVNDPWEDWNRDVQAFNDHLDDYVMKPVAEAYRWITPDFVDRGITNFFSNIDDVGVVINDFLQVKFEQGGMDTGRFLVNTTAGVGGFVDVASMIDLPKHNEDFDQTLGVWGVPMGPYMVLPIFGPSSPRGIMGLIGDALLNPLTYFGFISDLTSAISGGLGAVNAIDTRAELLEAERIADEAAIDRYQFFRDAYLQQRENLLKDGNIEEENSEFELDSLYTTKKGKLVETGANY